MQDERDTPETSDPEPAQQPAAADAGGEADKDDTAKTDPAKDET